MGNSYAVSVNFSWTIPAFTDLAGSFTWTHTRHWPVISLDANRMGIMSESHAEKWIEDLLTDAITLGGQRELPDNFRASIHASLVIA